MCGVACCRYPFPLSATHGSGGIRRPSKSGGSRGEGGDDDDEQQLLGVHGSNWTKEDLDGSEASKTNSEEPTPLRCFGH